MKYKKSLSERLTEFKAQRERQNSRKKPKELRAAGFKPVPLSEWWINNEVKAYNQRTGKTSNPRNIKTEGGGFCVEKIVLWLFAGIKPRKGQIIHLDGNRANKAFANLKYKTAVTMQPETVNRENLCTAIRCFFEIRKQAKPITSDICTLMSLGAIYEAVNFAERYRNEPYFSVFEWWVSKYSGGAFRYLQTQLTEPKTDTPPETLTTRELQTIKAHFTNLLTAEICAGLATGDRKSTRLNSSH